MNIFRLGDYTITAWAEHLQDKWQAMAAVTPAIGNTWVGGSRAESVIVGPLEASESRAETVALDLAAKAVEAHLKDQEKHAQ